VWTIAEIVKGSGDPGLTLRGAIRVWNPALGVVAASVALSLIGVAAIDVSELRPDGAAAAAWLSAMALKQLAFAAIGVVAALVVALPHYRLIGYLSWPLMVVVLGLLVFLLVPFVPESIVRPRNGARSWISLGFTDVQPSELAKIAYVLVVSHYMRYRTSHRKFLGLVAPGLLTLPVVALITLQPDLGTASLFVPALFAMLLAAGARIRHLVIIVVAAALVAPATYPFLRDHQKRRFVALVRQVQGDRSGADDINFQSFTAQTLVGSGGVSGNADGRARALLHFNRLPERHNDMIFSVIVTRWGFLGGLAVMGVYLFWMVSALATAAVCRAPFGRLLVVGLSAFVAAQMVVNIGMNLGLLPIIGITLPFVSSGGSSLVTSWLMVGLILSVGLHRPRPPFREAFEFGDEDG